ncbi:MAG: hypothetical protein LBI11_03925 [Streptococcaceae bacterium]|nr:hypothetical protein [Streptococcaceae bacterium]
MKKKSGVKRVVIALILVGILAFVGILLYSSHAADKKDITTSSSSKSSSTSLSSSDSAATSSSTQMAAPSSSVAGFASTVSSTQIQTSFSGQHTFETAQKYSLSCNFDKKTAVYHYTDSSGLKYTVNLTIKNLTNEQFELVDSGNFDVATLVSTDSNHSNLVVSAVNDGSNGYAIFALHNIFIQTN